MSTLIQPLCQMINEASEPGEVTNQQVAYLISTLDSMLDTTRQSLLNTIARITDVEAAQQAMAGLSQSEAIDNLHEVYNFLAGLRDSDTLVGKLADLRTEVSKKAAARDLDGLKQSFDCISFSQLASDTYIGTLDQYRGRVLNVLASDGGVSQGVLIHTNCDAMRLVQQVFITYLPLTSDGQINTTMHTDDGSVHIYTRAYAVSNAATLVNGERVEPGHWSKWREVAGDNVLNRISSISSDLDSFHTSTIRDLANLAKRQDDTTFVNATERYWLYEDNGFPQPKLLSQILPLLNADPDIRNAPGLIVTFCSLNGWVTYQFEGNGGISQEDHWHRFLTDADLDDISRRLSALER